MAMKITLMVVRESVNPSIAPSTPFTSLAMLVLDVLVLAAIDGVKHLARPTTIARTATRSTTQQRVIDATQMVSTTCRRTLIVTDFVHSMTALQPVVLRM